MSLSLEAYFQAMPDSLRSADVSDFAAASTTGGAGGGTTSLCLEQPCSNIADKVHENSNAIRIDMRTTYSRFHQSTGAGASLTTLSPGRDEAYCATATPASVSAAPASLMPV